MQFLLWTLYILSIVIGCFVFIGIFIVFAVFIQVSYSNTREIDKNKLVWPIQYCLLKSFAGDICCFFPSKIENPNNQEKKATAAGSYRQNIT